MKKDLESNKISDDKKITEEQYFKFM